MEVTHITPEVLSSDSADESEKGKGPQNTVIHESLASIQEVVAIPKV